jgi:predicted dienelactone hydrolase
VARRRAAVRRRRVVAVAGLIVVMAVAVVVIAETTTGPASSPTTVGPGSTTTAPSPTTTTAPAAHGPFTVGSLSLTVTEPATSGHADRTLTTYVRYPAVPGTGGPQTPATPDRASGPFPLVVFSGGYAVSPEEYSTVLTAWAAAGYVVADPVYPFTTPSSPGGLDEEDIVHHPGDLSAVITALLGADAGGGGGAPAGTSDGAAGGPSGTLAGVIEPDEIAAIGHSDGGDVTLAAVADLCCRDARIRAAVILSGAEYAAFGGTYFSTPTHLPLLVVQGTADDVNPEGCSVQLYDQAPRPKYYLSLLGQSHQSPYLQVGTPLDTVRRVTTDFLDGTLKGSTAALSAMTADGNVPGSSTLSAGTPTGLSAGSCPGAPGN